MARLFRRQFSLSFVLLAVTVLLIFLHYIGVLSPFENLLVKIVSPAQVQIYTLGVKIHNFYSQQTFNKDLAQANTKLEQQVRELLLENAQLKVLLEENFQIKNQVDFLAVAGLEAVTARIIGKGFGVESNLLILNKGEADGISINASVIANQGFIVGRVFAVSDKISKVILVNNSGSSLAATIQNQTQTKGVVVGEHGLSLKMELIPQSEEVKVGDVVVTSGLEVNIPRGLVIGQIERLENQPNGFFQVAYLQSLVNFDNLTVVSVLKSPR